MLSCSFSFEVFAFIVIACFYIYSYFRAIGSSFCKTTVLKSIYDYRSVVVFWLLVINIDLIVSVLVV